MTKLFFLGSPRCGTMALSSSLFWVRVQPCQHFFSSWNTERTRVVRYDRSALYTIGHTHRAPTLCSKLFAGQIVKKKLANLDLSEKTRILDFDNLCIFIVHDQSDQIWRNFATLASILKSLAIFGVFLSYLTKIEPTLAITILYGIGQMFIVVNGQTLNK